MPERFDVFNVLRQPREPQQQFFESPQLGGRVPAVAFKESKPADPANHLGGGAIGHWRDAGRDIGQHLDVNPEAEGDERAE